MKSLHVKLFALFIPIITIFISGIAQSPSFDWYMNPVIPGDHPDATLTRIGNDFYTTGSSFNVTPVIYHSTNLIHWEAIAQPVKASWSNYGDKPGGGCWGGHIVLYNGKYWDFYSRSNNMYFVTANDPKGPWTDPVMMNNPSALNFTLGYDNSIFIDDNNKWYLLVKNGQPNGAIVELGTDGQPNGVIYNLSWLNPAPDYPYSWAEGPVMWKFGEYYYYSFARDLGGGQKVMRSKTITADEASWEMLGDFFNESDPLKSGSLFTSPNHASPAIMLDDSTHWVIHPIYAKGEWRGQGRQGLLNQVRYDASLRPVADYPINKPFAAPKLPGSGIPWMVPKSDFFTSDVLNPEWSFLGFTADNTYSLTDKPGWFRLSPKSSTKANTIIKNDGEHNYSLITRLDFDAKSMNDQAGIQIMRGDETKFVKLYSSVNEYSHKVIVFSFENTKYEIENIVGNTLWLKIIRVNHSVSGYYSRNGSEWFQVGRNFDISVIDSYSDFSSFTGTRQGLYVQGSSAYFDLYIYRDAYTPILAECPANQSGTFPTTKTDGIYQLDSIHNNDCALYAGVEFGNDEYVKAPKSVEITASTAESGGTVEIWLDSIGTGTKVAEYTISGTGGWNTFETFSATVNRIEGRHDVYLRFTGSGSGRLFKLKWITFIAETGPEFVLATVSNDDTLRLKLSQPLLTPDLPSGLSIKINGMQDASISDISLAPNDSTLLIITLASAISNSDELTITYTSGTITNTYGIHLTPFTGFAVDNQMPGAAPKIKLLETKNEGDTLWMYLSKKMNSPASSFTNFSVGVEGKANISVKSVSLMKDDSSIVILVPESRIYYEDKVTLTYAGTSLEAINGGILAEFSSEPVQNTTVGYPPLIASSSIRKTGENYKYIDLIFDRPLLDASAEKDYFTISLNNEPVTIQSLTLHNDTISFAFTPYILFGDDIKINYSGGNVRSRYNGKLEYFSDYTVTNTIPGNGFRKTDYDENSDIIIFPNPGQSKIHIATQSPFKQLCFYNAEGKELIHKEFDIPVQSIDVLLDVEPGLYLVQLRNENVIDMKKFIIQ